MDEPMEVCSCTEYFAAGAEDPLERFAAVRSGCPALRELLLPDEVWPAFLAWHRTPDEVAYHGSVLLLAFERGHLARVTVALHRYLIKAGSVRPDVRQQYLKDLRERWMLYLCPTERHQKFRIFCGRLTELQFAEWLETQSWAILGLEALREGPDVEARDSHGQVSAFEVKFIGTEDEDFGRILESLAGQPSAAAVSPYVAANYLLFKAYHAGRQLRKATACHRVAVVIVDDLAWGRFVVPMNNGWIDWANPKFFDGDPDWERFAVNQRSLLHGFPGDVPAVIGGLDAVWILRRTYGFNYHVEFMQAIRK